MAKNELLDRHWATVCETFDYILKTMPLYAEMKELYSSGLDNLMKEKRYGTLYGYFADIINDICTLSSYRKLSE